MLTWSQTSQAIPVQTRTLRYRGFWVACQVLGQMCTDLGASCRQLSLHISTSAAGYSLHCICDHQTVPRRAYQIPMPRSGGQPARRWARCARIWAQSCKRPSTHAFYLRCSAQWRTSQSLACRVTQPRPWSTSQKIAKRCALIKLHQNLRLISAEHARILPALQRTMEEPRVQSYAAAALVNFAEDCEEVCLVGSISTCASMVMLSMRAS